MMTSKPVLIFDTSGLNQLADDVEFYVLQLGIWFGFFVRITETNTAEIVATTDVALAVCANNRQMITAVNTENRIFLKYPTYSSLHL